MIEGAVRAPVVFDNGNDLVIAQAPAEMADAAIIPTLEQLAGNLRSGGRSSQVVTIRLRQVRSAGEGVSEPVILGQKEVSNSSVPTSLQG